MATRIHSLGGSRSQSVTRNNQAPSMGSCVSRTTRWGGVLVWAYLAMGCGGKPELGYGAEQSAAGATSYYAQPSGGSGPGLAFSGGTAGVGVTEGPSICGNGTLERKEVCDDGNIVDGDGCSANCAVQDPHYDCSKPNQPCARWVICGNSAIEFDEVCDDGNALGGDGCSANCAAVEPGYGCAKPGIPCIVLPKCGNGVRERGEGCDDGEAVPDDGDGCSAKCQLETGFWCQTPGQPCVKESCGDGQRTPNEKCDDHNALSGDGCSERCQIEAGWRCTSLGCAPVCGDGLVVKGEECDDANHMTGDGCSAACRNEPYFSCAGQPSRCASTIVCGNGVREPGETCDPPGKSGCLAGCKSFAPDTGIVANAVCGNSIIELGESCDPPAVSSGCAADCTAEAGWICPRPGLCSRVPFCGDSAVSVGETCDDGNAASGDGCNSCGIEVNWNCYGLGPSKCVPEVCGDGLLSPKEQCDDKNAASGDGCSSTCATEAGWVCPVAGVACRPRCGDGVIVGSEACDDGNIKNSDGCNAGCRVEPGFNCPTQNQACVPSVCGNDKIEAGESCDDKNRVAGDGCSPTCQQEPTITPGPNPAVKVFCGDGLLTDAEECDDGNSAKGDGCDATCQKESGFDCESKLILPTTAEFQVTYRDFKAANALSAGGHPDFQYKITQSVAGITGQPCTSTNGPTCGRLDSEGKPQLQSGNVQATTGIRDASTFGLFFRSTNPSGIAGFNGAIQITPFTRTLLLTQSTTNTESYSYDANGQFYPLSASEGFGPIGSEVARCNNNQGVNDQAGSTTGTPNCDAACGTACQAKNFHFTTELRYFFQYRGGETLTFRGDDDVWVYINGRLAVDIGGVHEVLNGRVVLGDDGAPSGIDSNCSAHSATTLPVLADCYAAAEQSDTTDARFGLTKGRVYEIVLFHAERHTNQSNFLLTLSGFLAPRSYCHSICGDGILVAGEVCDDGANNKDGVSGACNTTCTSLAFCGDGVVQTGEQCDNGRNTDLYLTAGMSGACAPGCVTPPTCGDGIVQGTEQCDNGTLNTNGGYGPTSCTTSCMFGGYCGDGIVDAANGEVCDAGAKNGTSYGAGSCGYDCKSGPYYCGDGVRNGSEECDEGPTGGTGCDKECKLIPYCGDGLVETGETCDWGQFAAATYGSCTKGCIWAALCGDKVIDAPYEECDNGTAGNVGAYGGCTATCNLGPRCGDGALQSDQGEKCDNGMNDDAYEYTPTACGPNCQRPPFCGDGNLMPGYELCDNGPSNSDAAYGGCNTRCEYGPYCGDGTIDPQGGELCDNGRENIVYGTNASSCGLDCKPAPYCGDAERNGAEQCDLGTAMNTGAYGTCMPNCILAPRCGDKLIQSGEDCDDGPTGSPECSSSCKLRGQII